MFGKKRTYDWTMIDMHNHSLFGVDDGAKTLEMSLDMLKIAYDDGIRYLVLTPHYSPRRGKAPYQIILKNFDILREAAGKKLPGLSLYLGREVYYLSEVFEEVDKAVDVDIEETSYEWGKKTDQNNDYRGKDLKAIRMCGSRNLLLEFSFVTDFETMKRGVIDCFMAGLQPIIAHVERYSCIADDPMLIEELRQMGAYIQINADSIFGNTGKEARKCVKKLLRKEMVDFVATDTHNTTSRRAELSKARDYVASRYGEEYAKNIFRNNAKKLLLEKILD